MYLWMASSRLLLVKKEIKKYVSANGAKKIKLEIIIIDLHKFWRFTKINNIVLVR